MASKPKGKQNSNFPAEKMQALEFCLKEKGKELDELMTEFLESLYRKNVPLIMRKFLEPDEKCEKNDSEKEKVLDENSNENSAI